MYGVPLLAPPRSNLRFPNRKHVFAGISSASTQFTGWYTSPLCTSHPAASEQPAWADVRRSAPRRPRHLPIPEYTQDIEAEYRYLVAHFILLVSGSRTGCYVYWQDGIEFSYSAGVRRY